MNEQEQDHVCGDETYEDDSECVLCRYCKEWTCVVRCSDCDEVVFESACCG